MKKNGKQLLSLLLALVLLATCCVTAAAEPLQFGSDGKFTILHLTDTQDDQYPARELKPFLQKAIETAKPDLIVFTGDLVEDTRWGDFKDDFGIWEGVKVLGSKDKTKANATKAAEYVLQILSDSGVPFAMVQGNNDYKVNVDNESWLALYDQYTGNLTSDMSTDAEGIDYRLPILGSDGSVKLNVYCMDSMENGVSTASLDWYTADSAAQTAANGTVPAFVFQHIPVEEISNFFVPCDKNDPNAVLVAREDGVNFFKLSDAAHGYFDTVYYSKTGKSDEFAAWKQQGDIIAAFFGHMHQDGYSGIYDGIELSLTYGCEFAKSGPYGMRVITVDENDVASYDNQAYTYTDGTFTADTKDTPQKTFTEKIKLFIDSLLYIAKTLIKKVLPV